MLFWGWVCTNGCIQRQTTAHTTPHHTTQTKPTMRSTKGDGGVLGTPLLLNIIGPLQRVISGGGFEHRPLDHIDRRSRIHPLCLWAVGGRPLQSANQSPIVLSNRPILTRPCNNSPVSLKQPLSISHCGRGSGSEWRLSTESWGDGRAIAGRTTIAFSFKTKTAGKLGP